MKHFIIGGAAALLTSAGLIISAPQASAGCIYGGAVINQCDGPIQPDGTWQRCIATAQVIARGASGYLAPVKTCDQLGPNLPPGDPPDHIDG